MAKVSVAAFATRHRLFPPIPSFQTTITRYPITTAAMAAAPRPHPSLQLSGGALDSFLPAFTTLHRPYDSYPLIASNPHLETIFAHYFRSKPDVRYRRECIRTKDNGTVSLDWVAGDDRSLPPTAPALILLVSINIFPLDLDLSCMIPVFLKGNQCMMLTFKVETDIELG